MFPPTCLDTGPLYQSAEDASQRCQQPLLPLRPSSCRAASALFGQVQRFCPSQDPGFGEKGRKIPPFALEQGGDAGMDPQVSIRWSKFLSQRCFLGHESFGDAPTAPMPAAPWPGCSHGAGDAGTGRWERSRHHSQNWKVEARESFHVRGQQQGTRGI